MILGDVSVLDYAVVDCLPLLLSDSTSFGDNFGYNAVLRFKSKNQSKVVILGQITFGNYNESTDTFRVLDSYIMCQSPFLKDIDYSEHTMIYEMNI